MFNNFIFPAYSRLFVAAKRVSLKIMWSRCEEENEKPNSEDKIVLSKCRSYGLGRFFRFSKTAEITL